MKHWQLNQRGRALAAGAMLYAGIKAGLPREVFDNWLARGLPGLAADLGPGGARLVQAVLEGIGLATLILSIELALLWWSARRLLGHWVYCSSAGNWGHVVISVGSSTGGLRYEVDLYESEGALQRALAGGRGGGEDGFIGHGYNRFALHDGEITRVWYHVPEHRTAERHYPEREGILTLMGTNQKGTLSANWSRIGNIVGSAPPGATGTAAATSAAPAAAATAAGGATLGSINAQDRSHASGSFRFFMRRALYERTQQRAVRPQGGP